MSLVVPFVALFVVVALTALALARISALLFPSEAPAGMLIDRSAGLISAIAVVASFVTAAVAFPHSVVGFFARSPEHVEVSALVAAVAGAVAQSLGNYRGKSVRPGA